MCGIFGVLAPNDFLDGHALAAYAARLSHRGPDDYGAELLLDGRLYLAHRRLSIIDLSSLGHQPMASPDGKCWIVFNGEIYNFREVRRDLKAVGHTFRSDSDTEVILAAYQEWGLAAVQRFRGMFAFALWDSRSRQLHLCRDRFGVKPLYYLLHAGSLAFASEVKALHGLGVSSAGVDEVALAEFVQFGYVSAPRSLFGAVRSVVPGTILTFDTHIVPRENVYWSLTEQFDCESTRSLRTDLAALDEEALLDRMDHVLSEAFAYRMVADVPVGLFLSGGIDSSLVAGVLARNGGFHLRTFTIGYGDSEFDESRYARIVAEHIGAEHTEFSVSDTEALSLVQRLPEIADEPIGDSSMIPTLMVSQLARQHVKVALSADGADELFGGYARYEVVGRYLSESSPAMRSAYWLSGELLGRLPMVLVSAIYRATRGRDRRFAAIEDKIRKFVRMARAEDDFGAYEAAVSEWDRGGLRSLGMLAGGVETDARRMFNAPSVSDPRERLMHFDAARYLPGDLLTKVDRASMAVSLEAREPFLDHELARFAAALPVEWKLRNGQNKYLLRRLLDRYFPARLFDRPKHGFSAPVGEWLRGPLKEQLLFELSAERVKDAGLLDPAAVARAVQAFHQGTGDASAAGIWFLFQLQVWAGRWLKEVPVSPSRSGASGSNLDAAAGA